MDATGNDDQDIKLQQESANLIAKLELALGSFLWKFDGRRLVRISQTDRIIQLLEPFQEWPQLLDPYLKSFLGNLVSAFIKYLSHHADDYYKHKNSAISTHLIPLPRAICKILYTFCKIRGQKIVCRFLENQPRYMEPMLDALEVWANPEDPELMTMGPKYGFMVWEERFVMILWLSHYLLAPFDLSSIFSRETSKSPRILPLQMDFPTGMSPLAARLTTLFLHYLGFASKEREAAAIALARLVSRIDMQRMNLHTSVIEGTISMLDKGGDDLVVSNYLLIGIFSFLAKFIGSVELDVAEPLVGKIHSAVQNANSTGSPLYLQMNKLANTRKLVIKISREIAVAQIKINKRNELYEQTVEEDILGEIIDNILTALADKDTYIRFAASKALSIIAVQLEPPMVEQIIEETLDRLSEDTLWENHETGKGFSGSASRFQEMHLSRDPNEGFVCDFSRISALSWHGLILSLSQLIFRGSMMKSYLFRAINALMLALNFTQRSSLGVSTGSNVRDAACFGMWAIVRRYPTEEILEACTQPIDIRGSHNMTNSILQLLANELVAAATLDPSGNIRRGASAALQEMVGRHPDTIANGISLVQIVNYHAVASRSSAMLEVGVETSKLTDRAPNRPYWTTIMEGLRGWRGIDSPDVQSRRQAAKALGSLAVSRDFGLNWDALDYLCDRLPSLSRTEERHGIVLAIAEALLAWLSVKAGRSPDLAGVQEQASDESTPDKEYLECPYDYDVCSCPLHSNLRRLWPIFTTGTESKVNGKWLADILRSEINCEAVCFLMSALARISSSNMMPPPSMRDLELCDAALELSLKQTSPYVIDLTAQAAEDIFKFLDKSTQERLVLKWIKALRTSGPGLTQGSVLGTVAALGSIFKKLDTHELSSPISPEVSELFQHFQADEKSTTISPLQSLILRALVQQINVNSSIELRCNALKSLTSGALWPGVMIREILPALHTCLDDHTTDRRGDIGSLVRIEAIATASVVLTKILAYRLDYVKELEEIGLVAIEAVEKQSLIAKICGLAVEKLDKVRLSAWRCIEAKRIFEEPPSISITDLAQTSTEPYFRQMLSLCDKEWITQPLLEGFVTSAGAGSESVLRASRAAFVAYTETRSSEEVAMLCTTLLRILQQSHPTRDRLVIPTMNFIGFLFDAGVFGRVREQDFDWKSLFEITQSIHAKTSSIPKIEAALGIYAGLAYVSYMKQFVLGKLCRMLLHPYPKVRDKTADVLLIITSDEGILDVRWTRPVKELKGIVEAFKGRLGLVG